MCVYFVILSQEKATFCFMCTAAKSDSSWETCVTQGTSDVSWQIFVEALEEFSILLSNQTTALGVQCKEEYFHLTVESNRRIALVLLHYTL